MATMAASWALNLPAFGNPSSDDSFCVSPPPKYVPPPHKSSAALISSSHLSLRSDQSVFWRLHRKSFRRNSSSLSYGLVHIASGDLLRAEIASGSENGKLAKEYLKKGQLVPDEIVVMMVKERLSQPDSVEKGWLLDGYPRSSSQANALKEFGFQPDLFILLLVSEDILVERAVGRRLDPVTGKIYHLKYSPPENEEIAARLTQRFDDTEEKVKLRLAMHHQNVEAVVSMYEDITVKVDGNASKDVVFGEIDAALSKLLERKSDAGTTVAS